MKRPQWNFDDLQTFDRYSAEGHIGTNPLFEVMQQGDSYFRQADYSSALQVYQLLVKNEPQNGWLHYRLAHAMQKVQSFDLALDHYWSAFKLYLPSGMGEDYSPICLCDIGAVYVEKGDIEGAIAAFRLSARIRWSVVAAYGLGQALYLNGEPGAAKAALSDVVKYDKYKQNTVRLMSLIQAESPFLAM